MWREDKIEMDLEEVGCEGVNWIYLAQDNSTGDVLWMWYWTFGFDKRGEFIH
jgi:hypothetical protein